MEHSQLNLSLSKWKQSFTWNIKKVQITVLKESDKSIFFFQVVDSRQWRAIKTTPKFLATNIMFVTTVRKACNFIKWENSTAFGTPEALIKRLRIKSAPGLRKGSPAVAKTGHFNINVVKREKSDYLKWGERDSFVARPLYSLMISSVCKWLDD